MEKLIDEYVLWYFPEEGITERLFKCMLRDDCLTTQGIRQLCLSSTREGIKGTRKNSHNLKE